MEEREHPSPPFFFGADFSSIRSESPLNRVMLLAVPRKRKLHKQFHGYDGA
jgi:hypothetical protein